MAKIGYPDTKNKKQGQETSPFHYNPVPEVIETDYKSTDWSGVANAVGGAIKKKNTKPGDGEGKDDKEKK